MLCKFIHQVMNELDVYTWVCVSGCAEQIEQLFLPWQTQVLHLKPLYRKLELLPAQVILESQNPRTFPWGHNRFILLKLLSLISLFVAEISWEFDETDPAPYPKPTGHILCICQRDDLRKHSLIALVSERKPGLQQRDRQNQIWKYSLTSL